MEDENKVKKIMKYVIIAIIIIAIITIGFFIYRNIQININTNKLYSYLEKSNYTKNDENYYQKKSETENKTITDIAGTKEFVFARNITTSTDQEYSKIFMQYNNDNTIDITYSSEKLTNDKQISTSSQKGKLKDNKFSCDIISGNNNNISCDIIKKEAENYHKEIEKIIKDNKINLNYVKTDAKKVTKF